MTCQSSNPVTVTGILRGLESEVAKLDSLQSLCSVVAEAAGTVSDHATIGAVFAIMNSVEAIKDRIGEALHQIMALERQGERP